MAYIGNQPTIGQYRKLDDISGSFNGSLTAFTMQVGSTNVSAGSVFQLLISLGGVIQNPGTDFTVSGSTLTFTTAPTSGLDFFGILMGQPLNTATPGDSTVTGAKIVDGTITGAKLAAGFNYDSGLLFLDDTNNRVGIGITSPSRNLHVHDAGANNVYLQLSNSTTGSGATDGLQVFCQGSTGEAAIIQRENQPLAFWTNNDEKARIDSSGRLLVGTTTARAADFLTGSLQLEGTTQSASSIQLTCNSTASPGTTGVLSFSRTRGTAVGSSTIVQNEDSLGIINFTGADGDDIQSVAAQIEGEVDSTPGSNDMPGRLVFKTTADGASSPTERLRITSDGTLQLRNSPGIDFSQIQTNAAGMTSETLDSYEEGTWTPVFQDNSGNQATMTVQQGFYTKTGNIVNVWFQIAWSDKGSMGGIVYFTGFPFSAKSNSSQYYYLGTTIKNATTDGVVALAGNGTTAVSQPLNGPGSNQTPSDYNSSGRIICSMTYFT